MDEYVLVALQGQFNHERTNAQKYFYLKHQMENQAYDGFAKFFGSQANGEIGHADIIATYLISKRVAPEYWDITEVPEGNVDPRQAARFALETEVATTKRLSQVYHLAYEKGDHQTCAVIQPMLLEQVEEENVAADLVDRVSRVDNSGLETVDAQYR